MSLQGNGRNHNHKPKLNTENDVLREGIDYATKYQEATGEKPRAYSAEVGVDFASPVDRDKRIKEASEKEHASAYDDLDDYVYRQNKKRHRRRHRRNILAIPGLNKKRKAEHKHRHHRSKHHRRKKRWKTWQKVGVTFVCLILVLIIGLVGTIFVLNNKGKSELLKADNLAISVPNDITNQTDDGKYITTKDGRQFKFNENMTTILCMGIDKESLDTVNGTVGTGGSSDVLFLIAMDTATGETNMINISRDTMAEIGIYSSDGDYIESKEAQICMAYAYGDGQHTSCRNQIAAVRQLFYNIPINSYLALDLSGISVINDTLGGVTVTSPETIGPFIKGKTYTLKGSAAHTFVRKRTLEVVEGNSLRMERQKVYIEAFIKEFIAQTKKDLQTPINMYNAATPYICTNLDTSKITYLALNAIQGQINEFEVKSLPGEIKQGKVYAEFYHDEDELFEMFLDVYYEPVV